MDYEDYEPQFQLAPVISDHGSNPARRWFTQIVMHGCRPMQQGKPDWVQLPDRVWHRNSALLMSLRQRKRIDG
ncbi:MAG: hypothetical protein KME56_15675 [Candidatus Thiodiazotropha sp. (ex Ctena orbiculata)]|uniref:Uncharacterized protein n=1 Tax=Candidatus Thiodiazotropha taylori TaxID=2792791 RepID=A0A944MCZ5_9GAMM|nr:hypothetical protein [Candidatus Thiodiazotropha taylori]MBT2990399.1 hypothetical protein [Candidatus Thiodiazotropha taylori]MBT2998052.1 hypothetical protein [Candidatus Thiodiazotropha taylori]MBT3002263.1 hypothetical protein [Candidatus Thiodiazotropha taylori]MBT3029129.1 hypothetical protein [Candidatus Thiodiazotropha taylori]